MSIFWGFLFSFLYMLWFTLEVIGISWFWKCRFVKSQASIQKNNINLLLSTSWRLMKDSLWWASISLWMPYLPDSFLINWKEVPEYIYFHTISFHLNMKQLLSFKKEKKSYYTKKVTIQLLHDTFEFNEIVIEFMEIVKSGIKMWKYSNIKSLK